MLSYRTEPAAGSRTARALLLVASVALGSAGCGAPEPGPVHVPDPAADETSYVVMVSFDGMRYDFIDRVVAPNFRRVADAGVRATGLIPGYPTKTFPNHYGIATGLYPGHHGLVHNTFYDPDLDAVYSIGNRDAVEDPRWYGGEPIWVTAETQGVRTASYFWVGTEAPIQGVHPGIFKYYDGSVPYAARVDSVLAWLSLPAAERPRLVMLYFDQPDYIAHDRGPDHPAVDSVVRVLDGHLGRLLDGLERTPVADAVTVFLVSDHGMATVPQDRVVYIDDYIDLEGVRAIHTSTQTMLYLGGDTARIDSLARALDAMPRATAYRKAETPARWHYRQGRRIGDLVIEADPGWIIRTRDGRPWTGGGTHGWDPYFRPMHGIFLAQGPGIRAGVNIPAFENVHIYPLVAHLLGIEPADGIDGRFEVLAPILEPDGP
jgi:predicted AlkP superfamily pyrophosphatase or phosphodiesterase